MAAAPSDLRCSPSAERNAKPIGEVLVDHLAGCRRLLEIGSGTGQHASTLVGQMPGLIWQPSDWPCDSETISAWSKDAVGSDRIAAPITLNAADRTHWAAADRYDAVLTINTLHIMPWEQGRALLANAAMHAVSGCLLLIYGPFHIGGAATSEGNARFDVSLRQAGTGSGIRDIEQVRAEMAANQWLEVAHYHMPANNQMLVGRLA
ncbi:MAG: DUF938 domain-containing protein [Pseudomonadota bacterium]